MTTPASPRPLTGPPPQDVQLPRAPLARVIGQVRFPPILAIASTEKVAGFQEAIRTVYPILKKEQVHQITVSPTGPTVSEALIWRFADRDPDPQWRVSLSLDFISLESTAYNNRRDFLERMRVLIGAAETAFGPQDVQRLGLRYIDRLTGDGLEQIAKLVQPDVLGIAKPEEDHPSVLASAALHVLTEALFLADEGQIRARWGNLSANMTFDPDSIEPIQEPSWVLDLDIFTTTSQPFQTEPLVTTMTRMAERAYSVFREMITDEFLKFYGGKL